MGVENGGVGSTRNSGGLVDNLLNGILGNTLSGDSEGLLGNPLVLAKLQGATPLNIGNTVNQNANSGGAAGTSSAENTIGLRQQRKIFREF